MFWDTYTVSATGCWEYCGPLRPDGYADVGKQYGRLFHRAMWLRAGRPLPRAPFMLLHSCDNRKCGNPDHLRVGTRKENARDMVERGRNYIRNAGGTSWSRVRRVWIKELRDKGFSNKQVARALGISPQHASNIYMETK